MNFFQNTKNKLREKPILFILAPITAVAITVTGIIWRQDFIRILPLYFSLIIMFLNSKANRYALLLGGLNSILYTFTYIYLGLYASAAYAFFFSFIVQILSFIRWSKRSYKKSTEFRKLTSLQRILLLTGFLMAFCAVYFTLDAAGSSYKLLDTLSSLVSTIVTVLTMFAFIEYTWLWIPNSVLSIVLNAKTMVAHPEQITYLIYSVYALVCVITNFINVRKLYKEQTIQNQNSQ